MKQCFISLLSQTSEALADPDLSCSLLLASTVAVSAHSVLGALAEALQLTAHRFSDITRHELGAFCLVT